MLKLKKGYQLYLQQRFNFGFKFDLTRDKARSFVPFLSVIRFFVRLIKFRNGCNYFVDD